MTIRTSVTGSIFLFALCAAGALACSAEATDPYPDSDRDNDKGSNATAGSGNSAGSIGVAGTSSNTPGPSTGGSDSGSGGSSTTGSAGTATTAGTGNTASGGATSGCTAQVGAATDLLITDVDTTMSNAINMPRVGYWYTFADTGATVTPAPDPSGATPFTPQTTGGANTTAYYAGLTGSGGKYAGLGFALNDGGAGKVCTYDVSAYTGISFYYKSTHPLRVALSTTATTPAPKGTCAATCDNHHGKKVTAAAAEWTPFSAKWTELTQDFGTLSPFDKTQVLQIQFQIEGIWNTTEMVTDAIVGEYELDIDEITFTTD